MPYFPNWPGCPVLLCTEKYPYFPSDYWFYCFGYFSRVCWIRLWMGLSYMVVRPTQGLGENLHSVISFSFGLFGAPLYYHSYLVFIFHTFRVVVVEWIDSLLPKWLVISCLTRLFFICIIQEALFWSMLSLGLLFLVDFLVRDFWTPRRCSFWLLFMTALQCLDSSQVTVSSPFLSFCMEGSGFA